MTRGKRQEPRLRDRRWFGWLTNIVVVLGVYLAIRTYQTWGTADGDAPTLEATAIDGETVALSSLTAEGPVLVHFWATWCGVCKAEEGTLESLAQDQRVVSIATRSGGATDVSEYLASRDLTIPAVVDADGALARRWGVSAFPTSFVVNPDGEIQHVEVGYTTELGLRARLFLAGL